MNLAYHLGVSKIILLGYDFQLTGGMTHHHGDHPKGMANPHDISSWIKFWPAMAADLHKHGIEVINCTTHTALTCFERADIKSVI